MPLPVDIVKPHAIENVLPGRQAVEQNFRMKSLSGNASAVAEPMMVLKLSTTEHSTCIRAGRSARAQITAELAETSPD